MNRLLAAACALALAAAVPATAALARDARPFDAAQTLADVRILSADDMQGRAPGTPGGEAARRYVAQRMAQEGLTVIEHPFEFRRRRTPDKVERGVNLLAVIPGTDPSGPIMVVTAHYDHLGVVNGQIHNGADDNASGVAGLLAVARALKAAPPRHAVVLAALDAEEGGLNGARAFVAGPTPGVDLSRVGLNVNFDMISKNTKNELYAAGAYHTPLLEAPLKRVAARAPVSLLLGHDRPELGQGDWTLQSDHAAFHQAGVPFVYLGVEDHPEYHRPTDDFETVPQDFFLRAVDTAILVVRELDAVLPEIAAARRR